MGRSPHTQRPAGWLSWGQFLPPMFTNNTPHARIAATTSLTDSDDAELVRRFNAGEEAAFTEIMGRHQARILAVVRRQMNNHVDAEDITQDTFIRAHRGLSKFRGESSLATWLSRIAINLSRNHYWYFFRRHRQHTISLNQPATDQYPVHLSESLAVDSPGPAREAMHSEFVRLVAQCHEKLEEPHREILHMRYSLNYSYEQIGEKLNINFGTVKSRMARARGNLRKLIFSAVPEFGHLARLEDFF